MARVCMLAVLLASSLPAAMPALLARHFPDAGSEATIARDWHAAMQQWLAGRCAAGEFPRTWFPGAAGAEPHEIRAASERGLTTRKLLDTGALDAQGKPIRTPAPDNTTFGWDDWLPRYMLGTLPVEGEPRAAELVAFAAWLYSRKDPDLANRVLTVLHKRSAEERPDLETYVRLRENLPDGEPLQVAALWDAEFRAMRDLLVTAKRLEKLTKAREKEARAELASVHAALKDGTLTLAEVLFRLAAWEQTFVSTEYAAQSARERADLRKAAETRRTRKDELAASAGAATDKAAAAALWEEASGLDPADAAIASRAANLWKEAAGLQVRGGSLACTHEGHLREHAVKLYERVAGLAPGDAAVQLALGQCLHALGESAKARAAYNTALKLGLKPDDERRARELLEML
ncbi:MAG: tetratricopeptide repeat protein [Planctomycetes bacterium]|nr:tetratricopeptide repeat protein [Planctomycetota bacterium]